MEQDDLPSEVFRVEFCKLLNVQHINLARIAQDETESELEDLFEMHQWERINAANFTQSRSLLEELKFEENSTVIEELWLKLLTDNHYHRGRIMLLAEQEGIQLPEIQFTRILS